MGSSSEESVRKSRRRKRSSRDTFLEKLRCLEEEYKQTRSSETRRGIFRDRSRSPLRERARSHNRSRRRESGGRSVVRIAGKNRRTSYSSRERSRSRSRSVHNEWAKRADKENAERSANRRTSHSSRKRSVSPRRGRNSSDNKIDKTSGERYPRDASRSSRSRSNSSSRGSSPSSYDSEGEKSDTSVRQQDSEGKAVDLDAATLELLGSDPSKDDNFGPDIHSAVAERWEKIFRDGLSKELRLELLEKYPTINNCRLTKAPKLNLEVKAAIHALGLKKDAYQFLAQNQLGAGMNAVGAALTEVLKAEKSSEQTLDTTNIIARLADAGRILADLHHTMSKTRRSFIIPGLNPIIKLIADDSSVDSWLFGENFAERLKSAQAVEKSSKNLAKKSSGFRKSTDGREDNRKFQSSRSRNSGFSNHQYSAKLNWRRPSRPSHRGTQRKGQRPKDLRPKETQQNRE